MTLFEKLCCQQKKSSAVTDMHDLATLVLNQKGDPVVLAGIFRAHSTSIY